MEAPMSVLVDLETLELLCSRMAHDLINPMGAVANGLELLEEGDASDGDAIALCRQSVQRATTLMQVFRSAYGTAGSQPSFSADQARRLAGDFVAGGKCALDWPQATSLPERVGLGKLLLNLVLLAADVLPRGGRIGVGLSHSAAAFTVAVTAAGTGARLAEDFVAALASGAEAEALSPKSVQAYFTARLAERLGGEITAAAIGPDRVSFAVTLPQG
jgi:histidine phosphotransferase ChpT